MKYLIMAAVFFACATSAEAEEWTCSHEVLIGPETRGGTLSRTSQLSRFTPSPPVVFADIAGFNGLRFRLVQDDDYALVATETFSETEGTLDKSVDAMTVAINKVTGEFVLGYLTATEKKSDEEDVVHGKCLKKN
jgi:hypothetical protein